VEEGMPKNVEAILKEEDKFLSKLDKDDSVILLVDETYEIKKDNTSVAESYVLQKVLKEKGKDIAEVEINYDSTYERVEVEYARTITPSGRVVYAGAENTRDVTKYLNFPLYSNARAVIISMPSVEVGSIIEYKFKIYSSKLIAANNFSFIYKLKDKVPMAQENFKLITPRDSGVKFKFFNEQYAAGVNLGPKQEETDSHTVYTWQFNHVSPIIPEPVMPSLSLVNPAIGISNFKSWNDVYNWWYKLYKDKIVLDKEEKEFVKELIKNAKDDLEKAKRIYKFCAENVRYVAVEYGQSGYEPHAANEIFLNRYGDCKDKAILLVAMLREAGLKAYPVLIPTREMYDITKDFATANFNHAIAAVSLGENLVFMDATASTVSFSDLAPDDQERHVLVFFDDTYTVMPTPLIKDNEMHYVMQVNIDENEDALINRKVTTTGYFASAQRYYLKYTHPDIIKDDIQRKMVQISPFSKLLDYKIQNVDDFDKLPSLEYSFKADKILNPADNLRVLSVFDDINLDTAYAGKEERTFPIEFDTLIKQVSEIKINLPANLKLKFLPKDKILDTDWFDFKSSYKYEPGSIEVRREFSLKKRFVNQPEYKEFKKNLKEVFYLLREEVILEKINYGQEKKEGL
jgi:transglutaminase-like putative cysteine protease